VTTATAAAAPTTVTAAGLAFAALMRLAAMAGRLLVTRAAVLIAEAAAVVASATAAMVSAIAIATALGLAFMRDAGGLGGFLAAEESFESFQPADKAGGFLLRLGGRALAIGLMGARLETPFVAALTRFARIEGARLAALAAIAARFEGWARFAARWLRLRGRGTLRFPMDGRALRLLGRQDVELGRRCGFLRVGGFRGFGVGRRLGEFGFAWRGRRSGLRGIRLR